MNQPLAAAAGMAVLDVVEDERRQRPRPRRLRDRALQLAGRFEVVGDVRGPGLFVGIDYVLDRDRKTAATAACAEAWGWAVDHGLLCQFGGIDGNVLVGRRSPPRTTTSSGCSTWWPT